MGNIHTRRKVFGTDRRKNKSLILHVVGESSTGKTSLINKFLNEPPPQQGQADVEVEGLFKRKFKDVQVGKKKMCLTIFDCNPSHTVAPLKLTLSHGAIICFSLDDSISLERVEEFWIPQIKNKYSHVPVLLVGTKRDLRDNSRKLEHFIRESSGRTLVRKHKLKGYVECSAVADDGVEDVFNSFIFKNDDKGATK